MYKGRFIGGLVEGVYGDVYRGKYVSGGDM